MTRVQERRAATFVAALLYSDLSAQLTAFVDMTEHVVQIGSSEGGESEE